MNTDFLTLSSLVEYWLSCVFKNFIIQLLFSQTVPESETEKKPRLINEVHSGGCIDPDNICSNAGHRSPFSDAILEAAEDQNQDDQQTKEEIFINCFNLMIDVLNGQLEVQGIELKSGINSPNASDILALLTKVMSTPWFSDLSNGLEEVAFLNR